MMHRHFRTFLTVLTLCFATSMVLAPDADAKRTRVKKVEQHRYKCTYSDGSFTHTTAGSRSEARSNCDAWRNAQGMSAAEPEIVDEGPAQVAAESVQIKTGDGTTKSGDTGGTKPDATTTKKTTADDK